MRDCGSGFSDMEEYPAKFMKFMMPASQANLHKFTIAPA